MALDLSWSPGVVPAGQRLAERCRAEGLLAAWGCGPCPVTGRPSGTSDCSQRQNNARRAARASRAAPQRPARGASSAVSPGQPQAGSPGPLLLPAPCLSPAARSCTGCSCLVAQCGSLGAARTPAPSSSTSLPPPRLVQPSCPREGGDGRVHARMERVRCWGMGQVMGTNLLAQEDLKPCLCPERQPPRCPSMPCGCCRCSCSWGSAASGPGWSPQVSVGGHRGARVGTGEHRWMQWNSAAGRFAAMGTETTVIMAGVQHPTRAISPTSLHAAKITTKPPTAPWESCLGSLEPSSPGSHCGADRSAQSCYRVMV